MYRDDFGCFFEAFPERGFLTPNNLIIIHGCEQPFGDTNISLIWCAIDDSKMESICTEGELEYFTFPINFL